MWRGIPTRIHMLYTHATLAAEHRIQLWNNGSHWGILRCTVCSKVGDMAKSKISSSMSHYPQSWRTLSNHSLANVNVAYPVPPEYRNSFSWSLMTKYQHSLYSANAQAICPVFFIYHCHSDKIYPLQITSYKYKCSGPSKYELHAFLRLFYPGWWYFPHACANRCLRMIQNFDEAGDGPT